MNDRSERLSEVFRALIVTDEMMERAMAEFVLWTDPRDGMEQALRAAVSPARCLLREMCS
jgi:hypothetical protein